MMVNILRYGRKYALKKVIIEVLIDYLHNKNKSHVFDSPDQFAVFSNDFVGMYVTFFKGYEREELDAFVKWYGADKLFNGVTVDVGANVGTHSIYFSSLSKKVLSFEPHTKTYRLLDINTDSYNNIFCFNFALSDSAGTEILHAHPANLAGAHLSKYTKNMAGLGEGSIDEMHYEQEVNVSTLDLIVDSTDYPIKLLKIDAEGHELNVLKGGEGIIKKHKPVILFEQALNGFDENERSPVIDFLKRLGYEKFCYVSSSIKARDHYDNPPGVIRTLIDVFRASIFGVQLSVNCVEDIRPGYYPFLIALPVAN